jgi:filamentous hemagglutinin family protein
MSRIGHGTLLPAFGLGIGGIAFAATQLPIPCAPGACGNNNVFVTSGAATAVQSGKTLAVNQASNNVTLNWASFNISADGKVVFQQPSSTSVALNRIYDANPSSIFGALSANGQIYLINANGFLFGATSTVNVAGMIASSLNITDSTFNNGILAPLQNGQPALEQFTGNSQHFSDDGPSGAGKITNVGSITVQDGAQLTAASGGRLLLAAPLVQNAGSLTAPDGQIVLAAGQNIYLQASQDPAVRGLIVQVDGGTSAATQLMGVVNEASGALSAPRGNITLTGLMVNQDGRISATTSVSANGSVTLEAAQKPSLAAVPLTATVGGQVTIGPDSIIEVLPEYADTATAVDAQAQLPSSITITGQQVVMQGGSIRAPSGNLTVTAVANPSEGQQSGGNPEARIRIDAGTNIDLSGSDATLPMDANLVTVQLRSNEFSGDPTQRNGALRGDTVTVDVRADGGAGTPIADVSSAIAAVGRTIAQRTETGGTATFLSEGDIVFNPGASINVSGGATTYLGGSIQTTQLVGANGQLYDIGSANPLLSYTGVVNPTLTQTFDKWGVQEVVPTPGLSHYESGYQQGAAAGVVQFAAPNLVLDGNLQASAVYGPYQRGPFATGATLGGTLIIGTPRTTGNVNSDGQADYFAPAITVTANPTPIVVADTVPLPSQSLELPASYLTSDGFTNTQIYTNTSFQLPAKLPLQLPPGSSLLVQGSRIDIDSSITDLGGSLSFQSELTIADQNPLTAPTLGQGYPRLGIGVGDGVTFDVSGLWTNYSVLAGGMGSGPTLQNAGSINLQLTMPASELVLGNQVTLKADGGAWQQSNASLTYGKGGFITIDASPSQGALQFGQDLRVEAFGAYGAAGGSFALLAPRIDILQGTGTAWTEAQRVDDLDGQGEVLNVYAPLFSSYGFSYIALTATGAVQSSTTEDVLTVQGSTNGIAGTAINAQALSLQLEPGYQTRVSGGTIAGFSQPVMLPVNLRPTTNVSLNALRLADDILLGSTGYGAVDIQAGASIVADPGASISVAGEGNIVIGGTLKAPGGTVSIQLASPSLFNSNTATELDPGYVASLGISLASTALIDVSGGNAILTPNNQGLLLGTVKAGGSVDIDAQRGTVIIDSGAMINFSGSSATLDIATPSSGYTRETVATPGGSLVLSSPESIELLGNLQGKAGVGNSGSAAAGTLEIDLARNEVIQGQPDPNGEPLQISLVATEMGPATQPVLDSAAIGLSQITNSGVDSLILNAGGEAPGLISILTGQPLAMNRSVIFESQSLSVADGVAASIAAPYVQIGNPLTLLATNITQPTPTSGTGSLQVVANQLTLVGNLTLQGIGNITLTSQGDVQLQGTPVSLTGIETGSLLTSGNVTIQAARVYPDTFTSFTIQASGASPSSSNTVNIDQVMINGQPAASPGPPLSADGSVSVLADNIEVGGTLFAPFGSIVLNANKSLTLSDGSLVSVSGAGLVVPFGQTQENGAQWIYQNASGTQTPINATPGKQVSLTAPSVTVQSNATVDLRGGGDLYAYEWVPGTGGLSDALAGSGPQSTPGLYAILPAARGQAAPYDPQESASFSATQTVYLSGGAGVAPGYYALLPPRYALAPGALLVQIEPNYSSATGGQIGSLADGTPVVAGYLSSAGTALHTGSTVFEGFAIYPGGYGQQLASYNISSASTYFSAVAALAGTGPVTEPADAGSLTLSVVQGSNGLLNSLNLQGSVQTAAAAGGRGALINISAPNLEVTANGAALNPDFVAVSGSVLQSWNASALTLGGAATADGSSVSVAANSVIVDSGVNLTADQIFVVAEQSIDLNGALASTSGKNGATLATLPAIEQLTLSNPSAGLVAVSDLGLPVVTRSGSGAGASITLESGSSLSSGGALALDAPGNVILNGAINGKGASWSLASNSVAFVGSSTSPDTLNIDSSLLSSLQAAGAVRISSQGNIDLYAPVALGAGGASASPTLSSLTLLGTQLNNVVGADSVFGAANLTLGGAGPTPGGTAATSPVVGSGTLSFVANNFNLAPYAIGISGFASTVAQIAGTVSSAAGSTGGLNVAGNLTINAVELTPGAGSQTTINASGLLTLGAPTAPANGTTATTLVGGELTLNANAIADQGVIAAPSGIVSLNASGGDLELGATGSINVGGTLLQAVNQQAPSPGGTVALSASGNVTLNAGSMISVAGEQEAPAGSLAIVGGNVVSLAGTINGPAGSGGVGGSFALDAGQLSGGLTPLASLVTSGGFSNSVNVRVRSGDLQLQTGGVIESNSITLTADTGTVEIAGVLTATSGAQRGSIDMSAGTAVMLDASGQLHADGTGTTELGGEIQLNSTCPACSITLAPGSVITTAGTNQMGQLILRAPVSVDGTDVAINVGSTGIGADVSRVGQVAIDAVTTVQTSAGTVNSDLANAINSASNFLTNTSPGIAARLAAGSTPLSVQAGVELRDPTAETLTLQGVTDLSTYSDPAYYGLSQSPQIINVSVRAVGSININGTFSDGFITDPTGLSNLMALSSLPSASFSFVAGADTNSANPLSVLKGSAASLTLQSSSRAADGSTDGIGPSVVRTGTGDINLAAAGNVVFASASGGAAAVYTAGDAPANVLGPVSYNSGALIQNFGSNGGNVRVIAGGQVEGSPVGVSFTKSDGGNFSVSGWQLHQGSVGIPTQYGIDYGAFDWNVGALGGGDVTVTAGSNITNLSAATADSLVSGENTLNGISTMYGAGGGLSITAGGDIGSAQLFVADGVGTVIAGGGLIPTRTSARIGATGGLPVGSSIALDNAQLSVWARNGVQIDAIYNPTLIPQDTRQDSTLGGGYLTYGPASTVNLSSTTGAVTIELNAAANGPMATLLGTTEVVRGGANLLVAPPNLSVQALQGDIVVNGGPNLAPASDGQLSLFAARDILGGTSGTNNQFTLSDAFLSAVPTVADPSLLGNVIVPFQGVIHSGDSDPVLVTAGRDINGVNFSIPKAADIVAGRDIINLSYAGQNTSASDVTLISAGRDLTSVGSAALGGIQLGGPGSIDVVTGRNLNFGFGDGIVTLGNLVNANLPTSQGANANLIVGYGTQGADLSGFVTQIIAPSATYQAQLTNYVESLEGTSGLSFTQAEAQFSALSTSQQTALVDDVFFHELLLSGRAANSGLGVGFQEGYNAIDALFPGSRSSAANAASPYAGNLTLTSSRIYTDSGGNISILVPGGEIDVGLANPPPTVVAKPASSLGIVAEGAGNVNIYAEGDVNVNKSRVFTLGGGNILIWSDEGSIDAGNGSKSSLSVPPPTVSVNKAGVVTLNFGGSLATGSGIRTIQTNPSVSAGDVDLDAPVGTVNAGDAGIGAAGNINIAAAHVIGVDNINFGGTATGVPSDLSSLSASLSGVSAVAAGATSSSTSSISEANAAKETVPLAQNALSWLDVFVTGLGEENCKQDDIECLKRQRAAAP